MITTRRQAPIQLSRTTTGSTALGLLNERSESAQTVAPGCSAVIRVSGSARSVVAGGESDGESVVAFGPFDISVTRGPDDIVTLNGDLGPHVPDTAMGGDLIIDILANDDDGDLTGFVITMEEHRGNGGGTRTTTVTAIVERVLETLGS